MASMIDLHAGTVVTHPDRYIQTEGRSELGTVIQSDRRPAWTPNEQTRDAPDTGMVKVHWHDSCDDATLYWEYAAELDVAQLSERSTGTMGVN